VPKLSVTVITRNESANIAKALESVAWADEIVVVDSESTDDTVAQAQRFTSRVVVRPWPGYAAQKNFAASLAAHDWILSLDADERVPPALAAEIRTTLAADPRHAGYRIPRVAHHLGRWIRTTDWYPDDQLRLYDRRAAQWTGAYVHESVAARGTVGRLQNELYHYPYRDVADHLETIDRYTTLAAREMHEAGRRSGPLQIAGHPPFAFLRNYLLRGGFRDGVPGLIISTLNAYYVFLKFSKLWQLQHPTASTEHPTASTEHPTASTEHPTASSEHPTASSEHPTASTEHPTGSGKHPAGSPQHSGGSTQHPAPKHPAP
jgi:glycosyltransferase involved in cell wall biosynthesis